MLCYVRVNYGNRRIKKPPSSKATLIKSDKLELVAGNTFIPMNDSQIIRCLPDPKLPINKSPSQKRYVSIRIVKVTHLHHLSETPEKVCSVCSNSIP